MVQEALSHYPLPLYPDLNEIFHLYTDPSKYTWSGALTQRRKEINWKGNTKYLDYPVPFVSGSFQGSEENWSAFQKEAAAILRSIVKKLILPPGL